MNLYTDTTLHAHDYPAIVAAQEHAERCAWPCLPLEDDPDAEPVWGDDWHAAYVEWGLAKRKGGSDGL